MNENSNVTYGSITPPDPKVINEIFTKFGFNPDWLNNHSNEMVAHVVPKGIALS